MSISIGEMFCGDTDGALLPVSPAAVLIGTTVRAKLWEGAIGSPSFVIRKPHEALTIDTSTGIVEIPLLEADWAGVPQRLRSKRFVLTIELELRRDGTVKTLEHRTLTVKPEGQR